ncbi:hypothetical protein BDW68DRAFT_183268 [Aspergillus falconensis]
MHLAQMVARCSDSEILAKGILAGYRWQIDERDVANIIPYSITSDERRSVVQRILFTVSPKDIRALDRNEGVAKGSYDKLFLRIRVEPLAAAVEALKGVKTALARREERQVSQLSSGGEFSGNRLEAKEVEALVYLSSRYNNDGQIWSEYIGRMQLAVADAQKLGIG